MRQAPLEIHESLDPVNRVPNRIPRVLDRPHDRIFDRVPGRGSNAPDTAPCIGEKAPDVRQYRDHHSLHLVQDIRDIGPKEGKKYVQDVLHRICDVSERSCDPVPDGRKDLADALPQQVPVACEQPAEYIKDPCDHAKDCFNIYGDGIKGSYEDWTKELTEAFPDKPDEICNIREAKTKSREPLFYPLHKCGNGGFDLIPGSYDGIPESLVCFP